MEDIDFEAILVLLLKNLTEEIQGFNNIINVNGRVPFMIDVSRYGGQVGTLFEGIIIDSNDLAEFTRKMSDKYLPNGEESPAAFQLRENSNRRAELAALKRAALAKLTMEERSLLGLREKPLCK